MPALTMRGRYLMREYWEDSDLFLRLTSEQREVYQGLWMLADDAGWMPRDVPAISASIYRYEDRAVRESRVKTALGRLGDLGKVLSHRCCLYIPAVEAYPRSGKRTQEHWKEHERHSKGQIFKRIQTDSNGLGSNGSHIEPDSNASPVPSLPDLSSRARATTEFQEKVPRPRVIS